MAIVFNLVQMVMLVNTLIAMMAKTVSCCAPWDALGYPNMDHPWS